MAAPQAIQGNRESSAAITLEATVIVSTIAIRPRDICRNLSIFEPRYQALIAYDISVGTSLAGSTDQLIKTGHLSLIMNVS
jgi:hypothetical protein